MKRLTIVLLAVSLMLSGCGVGDIFKIAYKASKSADDDSDNGSGWSSGSDDDEDDWDWDSDDDSDDEDESYAVTVDYDDADFSAYSASAVDANYDIASKIEYSSYDGYGTTVCLKGTMVGFGDTGLDDRNIWSAGYMIVKDGDGNEWYVLAPSHNRYYFEYDESIQDITVYGDYSTLAWYGGVMDETQIPCIVSYYVEYGENIYCVEKHYDGMVAGGFYTQVNKETAFQDDCEEARYGADDNWYSGAKFVVEGDITEINMDMLEIRIDIHDEYNNDCKIKCNASNDDEFRKILSQLSIGDTIRGYGYVTDSFSYAIQAYAIEF